MKKFLSLFGFRKVNTEPLPKVKSKAENNFALSPFTRGRVVESNRTDLTKLILKVRTGEWRISIKPEFQKEECVKIFTDNLIGFR